MMEFKKVNESFYIYYLVGTDFGSAILSHNFINNGVRASARNATAIPTTASVT
jgi:hypothetical protein